MRRGVDGNAFVQTRCSSRQKVSGAGQRSQSLRRSVSTSSPLCFENSILKGWVTEKIFDCLFTGTIPVYLGAPEITSHVPADCFIDMRRFSGYDELRKYLRSLDEQEISKFKRNARDYLQSDQFRPFSKSAFVDLFRRIVAEDTGASMENRA